MVPAENTASKQRGRPFSRGQSGNPSGKPIGARNRTTMAVEALLDGDAERLTRKVVAAALDGDMTAMRLCLERICPPRKDRPIVFRLPKMNKAADAAKAGAAIVSGVADGKITPSDAAALSKLIDLYRQILEATNFEVRLEALERQARECR